MTRDTSLLEKLVRAHATPGDEGEVAELLLASWQEAGLATRRIGTHAVVAECGPETDKPTLLVTAHMDSTGFAVDRFYGAHFGLTALGHPDITAPETPAVLKTREGRATGILRKEGEERFTFHPDGAVTARHGDRVAFAPTFVRRGTKIFEPYLDNRLGCWTLALLGQKLRGWKTPWRVVLAATGSEEMCGHGAAVLARAIRPCAVVVVDTTYASREQGVALGKGPVLTLSDASVLLPLDVRDRLMDAFASAGLPLQTEVYNFSGTDAKAFPLAGLPGVVAPLLLPTEGNHSPRETADLRDVDALLNGLRMILEDQTLMECAP
ncbi:MAG: hypothetical protein FWF96_01945 [Kiritimatiellaeota bacterium]|nr:hypothetical protein [Kiritimatiellota bacterium]